MEEQKCEVDKLLDTYSGFHSTETKDMNYFLMLAT